MEKNIFTFEKSKIGKIKAKPFSSEKLMQNILEQMIINEKRLLSSKIIAYKREAKTDSGRPDFVLIDSEGRVIIVECKRIDNEEIRRKVIAQLLDYQVAINQVIQPAALASFEKLVDKSIDITPDSSEISLIIVSDNVHPQLHRLVTFLETKNIIIKIITINKFTIDNREFYTITPHDTEPEQINQSTIEKLQTQINTFGRDANKIKSILNEVEGQKDIASIKPGKKRISIHVNGASDRFAIWLSQEGIRNINITNLSIPKVTFQPCEDETYKEILAEIEMNFNIERIDFDDVYAYIPIELIYDEIGKLINLIYDKLK